MSLMDTYYTLAMIPVAVVALTIIEMVRLGITDIVKGR